MSEERDNLEFNDPLAGLDLGLLNINSEGEKSAEPMGGEGRSAFEVRDVDSDIGEDTPPADDIPAAETGDDKIEIKGDDESDDFEFNTPPTIEAREVADSDIEDEDEDYSGANDMWKAFSEAGLISLEEDELEDDSPKDLEWFATKAEAKIEEKVKDAVDDYKESLPDELKYVLDHYDQGVSVMDLLNADKSIIDYANISDDKLEASESTQKRVMKEYLSLTGESPEDIEEMIEDFEIGGMLEKHSKKALKKLVNHQVKQKEALVKQQRAEAEQKQTQYREMLSNLKSNIDEKEEIIPGIELNDKQKKQLYNGITKFDKQGKNEVMKFREANPDFDLVMAYFATVLKTSDNKINWSKFQEIADTKANVRIKEKAVKGDRIKGAKRKSKLSSVDFNTMKNAIKF